MDKMLWATTVIAVLLLHVWASFTVLTRCTINSSVTPLNSVGIVTPFVLILFVTFFLPSVPNA